MKNRSIILLIIFILMSFPVFSMGDPPNEKIADIRESLKAVSSDQPFSISIDKPSIDIISKPGSAADGTILIENNGSIALNIRTYAQDWKYENDGSKSFYNAGTTKNSCADWIHVNPKSFSLNPLETKEIKYVVTTPKNASGGSVAVIFFESIFDEKDGIMIGGRIGSIVYQETEGKTKRTGEISEFLISKGKEGNAVVKLSYKNTGNTHTVLSPKLSIFTVNNEKIRDIDMPRIKALPGDTVVVEKEYKIVSGSRAEVYIALDGKTLKKNTKFPPK